MVLPHFRFSAAERTFLQENPIMKTLFSLLGLMILLGAAGCAVEPVYPATEYQSRSMANIRARMTVMEAITGGIIPTIETITSTGIILTGIKWFLAVGGAMEYSCAPFPLTPTLSPRRGGTLACPHQITARFDFGARGSVAPSPWGEGWGEGERDRRQKRTSYVQLEPPTESVEEPITCCLGRAAPQSGTLALCLSTADSLQQLSMDPAKPAVAENAHDVAALHILRHVSDNGLDIRQIRGGFAGTLQILH